MKLHTISPAKGSRQSEKRIGRGQGSGHGGTSTRGHKGQQSRSGATFRPWFEGGQMPLQRRIPKFGFKNRFRVEYAVINLDTLQEYADAFPGETIDHDFLVHHGRISKKDLVKVLGRGELNAKVEVKLNKYSGTAKAAIEAVGGTATEV
ncbi:MAG: 50S ribosomal protein L15 [Bacteroidia bacterium]|nr:50S ribosomal protein L15 [Bacteroidia bacterium]